MRRTLAFPHPPQALGGPGSFQIRLSDALADHGWDITYADSGIQPDVVLVVAGTRKLAWLWRCKRAGARIVHRLDGFHWRQRFLNVSLRGQFAAARLNLLIAFIRNHFADHVVYQSEFIRRRWYDRHGPASCPETVIHNGITLDEFKPSDTPSSGPRKLVCVEGVLAANEAYTRPLEFLAERLHEQGLIRETLVCGRQESEPSAEQAALHERIGLRFLGNVPREQMPEIYRDALYLVLEVHPPCPNSVVEALASGAPVLGFDTGSLSELVSEGAGRVIPYGADAWKLEVPNVEALEPAAREILANFEAYSRAARRSAEERFSVEDMLARYLEVLEPSQ